MKKILLSAIILLFLKIAYPQTILPDPSFGKGGVLQYGPAPINDDDENGLFSGRLDHNKVLILLTVGDQRDIVATRRMENGNIDSSYGIYGYAPLQGLVQVRSAVLQRDDKLIVTGIGSGNTCITIRLDTSGLRDRSFGENGVLNLAELEYSKFIAARPDGKILLSGHTAAGDNVLMRLTENGMPDSTFGEAGILKPVVPDHSGGIDIHSFDVTDDEKIVFSLAMEGQFITPLAIMRYFSDGRIDSGFNKTGVWIRQGWTEHSQVIALPENRILVSAVVVEGVSTLPPPPIGPRKRGWLFRFNNDGSFDSSFYSTGIMDINYFFPYESYSGFLIDALQDGKIFGRIKSSPMGIILQRWNTDGSPDSTFGTANDGLQRLSYDIDNPVFFPSGRMLALMSAGTDCIAIAFTSNGNADSSYATAGRATVIVPHGQIVINGIVVQNDQRIVYNARGSLTVRNDMSVTARVNANGSDDTGFGFFSSNTPINTVVKQGDKILTRVRSSANGLDWAPVLTRLNMDGTIDLTFGKDGRTSAVPGSSVTGYPFTVQPDGKILEAGTGDRPGTYKAGIIRYTKDGRIDVSFGKDGIAVFNSGFPVQNMVVACLPEGKILFGGISRNNEGGNLQLFFARLDQYGSLDPSFGVAGIFFRDSIQFDETDGLIIQKDGKFLVGLADIIYGAPERQFTYAIARFNANGTPDSSFGLNGSISTPNSKFTLLDNQKIVVASATQSSLNTDELLLTRYLPDGNPDTAFGNEGRQITKIFPPVASVDIVKYDQGKLYVVALRTEPNVSGALIRYDVGDYSRYCPEDKIMITAPGHDTAIVNDIDPIVGLSVYPDVLYRLSGATNGQGRGSASGRSFNKGTTLVRYYYERDSSVFCNFNVTVTSPDSSGIELLTSTAKNTSRLSETDLHVAVAPNPAASDFVFTLLSENKTDKIDLRIVDLYNTVMVSFANRAAGETIVYGSSLKRGIYFLEVRQGNVRKFFQLMKL